MKNGKSKITRKDIHLDDEVVKILSKMAEEDKRPFKNYVEKVLSDLAYEYNKKETK